MEISDFFIYLSYFGKYGCYNLVSERGSVPAPIRDGDLGDSDFSDFQCLLGIGNFKIKVTPLCP